MSDGILWPWIHVSGGGSRLLMAVTEGGYRANTVNGKRHVLSWRAWMLHHAHNTAAGGHVGADGVENKILTVGWWSDLRKDCEAWVSRCITCRAIKGHTLGASTWRSERYTSPFRVLQVDLITDLVPISNGYSHILTAIDCFTLWIWLIPIVDKSAISVATALLYGVYLDLAGFPVILRSDNGKEFVAEVTRELNDLLGTTQIFGSAYHPRSQALVEGSHRPTEAVLQAFVQDHPETWAAKLPIARWAWNTTPKKSLGGMTPYQVVTGLVPRNPIAAMIESGTGREVITPNEYVQNLISSLNDIYQNIMKAQEERAKEAEARGEAGRVARHLQEGEHVLLRRPPPKLREDGQEVKVSAKLQPKARLEAYVILKRIGENYVLGDVATKREITTFSQPVHADRLVPLNVQELTKPVEEKHRIILEGVHPGTIVAQAVDGRVKVHMADRGREEAFFKTHRKLGIVLDEPRGLWVDLSRFDYFFDD